MKVFVVLFHIQYEDTEIEGIFDSKEKAIEYISKSDDELKISPYSLIVKEYEVK